MCPWTLGKAKFDRKRAAAPTEHGFSGERKVSGIPKIIWKPSGREANIKII
jgi:hypothetical protein